MRALLALMRATEDCSGTGAKSKKPESPKLYEKSRRLVVSTFSRDAVEAPSIFAAAAAAFVRAVLAADGQSSSRADCSAALLLPASCLA